MSAWAPRHPAALAAWSAACLVAALASTSPVYRALVLAGAALMVAARPRPEASRRPLLVGVVAAGAVAILLNLLLSHSGATVLMQLPGGLPLVGGPLTLEAAAFGAATGLALAAAILAVAPLSLLLQPDELLDAVPRHLERTGAALATTLSLGPGLVRGFTAVREAQTMRGWRPRGPRSWVEIVVPVCLTAMEESIQVAEAMEARAFGAGPRTPPEPLHWRPGDLLCAAVAALAAAAFLAARAAGLPEDWAAYPTLAVPPADPLLVAAASLLAVPAVLRWRSRD